MSHAEIEEVEKKRTAIFNCSRAMVETIRSYGFAATLDLLVRISNHDTIVSELLPYFPSIASNALMEGSDSKLGSKLIAESAEAQVSKTDVPDAVTSSHSSPSRGKGRGKRRHQLSLFSNETKKEI